MTGAILDTDVFSVMLDDRPGAEDYAAATDGVRTSLAFPSIGELLYGAYRAGWGPARLALLEDGIRRHGLLLPTEELLEVYGRLHADAARSGHALAQHEHANDRWIAACAIFYGVPLLTNNVRHFAGCPGLELLPA